MKLAERQQKEKTFDPPIGSPRTIDGASFPPGEAPRDRLGLPHGCPVTPLGMDGDMLHLMDSLGQLRSISPSAMGQKMIQSLFGARQAYLYWAWPRKGPGSEKQPWVVNGWRAEKVAEDLYQAAATKGLFDPRDRVRGRGAWASRRGALVWHSGGTLWRTDRTRKGKMGELEYLPQDVGDVEGYFYSRRPDVLEPWPLPCEASDNPAIEIFKLLRCWNWERPEIDPLLFLGWLVAALLAGALDWRPTLFVTADAAAGKSSLHKLVKLVFGACLLEAADATAAGIYQAVNQDSLPVAVDELEAESDPRKAMAIVKLARIAASGAKMRRGGTEHDPVEFRAQNCFFFSAINVPGLEPQDQSRMAILRLRALSKSDGAPTLSEPETIGPRLLRRLLDGWAAFPGALRDWRGLLRWAGHDGRAQDTFGTLLACAALALGEEGREALEAPGLDDQSWWAEHMPPNERVANWRGCLRHLLTVRVDHWRHQTRTTIGAALEQFYEQEQTSGFGDEERFGFEDCRRLLASAGVGLLKPALDEGRTLEEGCVLAVPFESPKLEALFRGTKWVGGPGASVWKDALRQAPAELLVNAKKNRVRIDGDQTRCVLIKLGVYWKGEW